MSSNWYEQWGKRAGDILISSTLILLLAPIALVISPALMMSTKGKLLFRQRRYATGRVIPVRKFRTMRRAKNQETGVEILITPPFCQLIRWIGLDEYPNLFHVLFGSLTMVGPRVLKPDEAARMIHNPTYRNTPKAIFTPAFTERRQHKDEEGDWHEIRYCMRPKTPQEDLLIVCQCLLEIAKGFGRRLFTNDMEQQVTETAAESESR